MGEQEEEVEAIAEVLSWACGEMTRWQEDAHPDHNRWSWRGDGHGPNLYRWHREAARELLASTAMRGLLAEERAKGYDDACEHDIAVCRGDQCSHNPYRDRA